jgi:hypothetical protein
VSLKIEVYNLESLRRRLNGLGAKAEDAFEASMVDEAQMVIDAAQQTVPVVSGRLRSSAFVRKVARNQHRSDIRFGYDAPYASQVHERPGGKGYKWLATAANRLLHGMSGRVAARIKAALR